MHRVSHAPPPSIPARLDITKNKQHHTHRSSRPEQALGDVADEEVRQERHKSTGEVPERYREGAHDCTRASGFGQGVLEGHDEVDHLFGPAFFEMGCEFGG